MNKQKEYLINIFFKRCVLLEPFEKHLKFYFEWCGQTYNISDNNLSELKKKFTIEEYKSRLVPIIDKHFSIDDLQNAIKFYSSDTGKKMLSSVFMEDIGRIGSNMEAQLEQEFSINNKKNPYK